jgi:SAM-dependent methyltransferase
MLPEPRAETVDYDAELRALDARLRRAYEFRPDDHVLDIGCGAGRTTCDAARIVVAGSVLGVDPSAAAIERARQRARSEDLHNVGFEVGDAQVYAFEPATFDVVISRFGTMFFADPVSAFRNIAGAMRPGARLVMMVWQAHERNEWAVSIDRALGAAQDVPRPSTVAPGPFSLGDPATVTTIFAAAHFTEVAMIDVHEPVYYGRDVRAAMEWVSGFSDVRATFAGLDADAQERARRRLTGTLANHAGADGVWFDARAWIATARRT